MCRECALVRSPPALQHLQWSHTVHYVMVKNVDLLQYHRPEWLTERYQCFFQQGGWLVNLPKPGKFHFAHVSVSCGIFRRHYRVCLCHPNKCTCYTRSCFSSSVTNQKKDTHWKMSGETCVIVSSMEVRLQNANVDAIVPTAGKRFNVLTRVTAKTRSPSCHWSKWHYGHRQNFS